jgi:hypothetical protein
MRDQLDRRMIRPGPITSGMLRGVKRTEDTQTQTVAVDQAPVAAKPTADLPSVPGPTVDLNA